jgi:hypothetical protein
MSEFSARTHTPRLRTASFGVEGWTLNTVGLESMDAIGPLYSSEDRPSMPNSSRIERPERKRPSAPSAAGTAPLIGPEVISGHIVNN